MPVGIEYKTERERLIRKEKNRLLRLFQAVDEEKVKVVGGLIERAAFLRIHLDELEDDLNGNGWTEWFSQGDQDPYKRSRPEAEQYHKLNANYQKIVKQLTDLLPKAERPAQDDGFEGFVRGREG